MLRLAPLAAVLSALAAAPLPAQVAPWPTREWARATPESQQVSPAPWAALDSAIRAGRHGHVDRLLVIRNGFLVLDHAYPRDYAAIAAGRRSVIGCGPGACEGYSVAGEYNYFDPVTHPFYRGSEVHSLQSVTKSVMATLVGIALERGEIASLQAPLMDFLRRYEDVRPDPRLERATLHDLLTMRTGVEWHEQDRPLDTTNTTVQLEWSDDWVRFTLSQPMDADPGMKWAYNSGGSHLIGAVLDYATGVHPIEYARRHLFAPLGIRDFHWKLAGGGLPDGEGGLYLSAESLAKIGYLYLRGGMWDGQRILPADFVREATWTLATTPSGMGYGFQWWRADREGLEVWAGLGFGGQALLVVPSLDLVAVVMGWNVYGERVPGLVGPVIAAIRASAR